MKFQKLSNIYKAIDLKIVDIRNFIACQIPFKIVFTNSNIEMFSLNIGKRLIVNKKSMIEVNGNIISRDECLKEITKGYKEGIPEIIIDSKIFDKKDSLIELLQTGKQIYLAILDSGIVDYEDNLLSIIIPNLSGGSLNTEEIYYWPENEPKTAYAFKAKSVEIYPIAPSSISVETLLYK